MAYKYFEYSLLINMKFSTVKNSAHGKSIINFFIGKNPFNKTYKFLRYIRPDSRQFNVYDKKYIFVIFEFKHTRNDFENFHAAPIFRQSTTAKAYILHIIHCKVL